MTKRKLIPLLLASAMALSLAACGDKSDGKETKSETESTASQPADSSAVSQPDESSGAVSSAEERKPEEYPAAVSNAEESKAGESAPEQNVTEVPSLKELAKELFGAKEFPENNFRDTYDIEFDKMGIVSLCGVLKAEDICDPFDDLFGKYAINDIKSKGVNPEVFDLTYTYQLDEHSVSTDGGLIGLGFYCKDAEQAKDVYSCLFDDEWKHYFEEETADPNEVRNNKVTDNYALIKLSEKQYFGYYLVGNAVFVLASGGGDKDVGNQLDYKTELERLCEALNLESPTKL